ncbi:unnamed protein product [Sphagnum tenellum]
MPPLSTEEVRRRWDAARVGPGGEDTREAQEGPRAAAAAAARSSRTTSPATTTTTPRSCTPVPPRLLDQGVAARAGEEQEADRGRGEGDTGRGDEGAAVWQGRHRHEVGAGAAHQAPLAPAGDGSGDGDAAGQVAPLGDHLPRDTRTHLTSSAEGDGEEEVGQDVEEQIQPEVESSSQVSAMKDVLESLKAEEAAIERTLETNIQRLSMIRKKKMEVEKSLRGFI